jgi:hypothetical protein
MTDTDLRAWRVTDAAAWNTFVESAPYHAFPQLWEWGRVREMGGWRPVRLAIGPDRDHPVAGAQLLLRRLPVVGWHLAYVPRGPIGDLDDTGRSCARCTRSARRSELPPCAPIPRLGSGRRTGTRCGPIPGASPRRSSRRRPGSST